MFRANVANKHSTVCDIYYRLNVFAIALPPLSERREDIPLLVRHFTQQVAKRMGRRIEAIPAGIMDALVSYLLQPVSVKSFHNLNKPL